jgi:hypothetical protein
MDRAEGLLQKVKANLILEHDADDELILGNIRAALDYAEGYQKRKYRRKMLPAATEQAVIMLASHFYESRDGSTAGFYADSTQASAQVWMAVNNLLRLGRDWGKSV